MRRDIVRIGIGRFLLEGALGVVLARPMADGDRILAIAMALAAAMLAHFAVKGARRAFIAAHIALGAAAVAAHLPPRFASVTFAAGLGAAIELVHLDLLQRRRMSEDLRTLRIPSSLFVRRLGTMVVVAILGRSTLPLVAMGAHPAGLAAIFVVLAVIGMLTAGFGAGPGRPVTRPIDALVFVLFAIVLALPTTWI